MLKHFVLNLNPNAQFEWERCTLHNPITANQPNLAQLVAQSVGEQSGSYLVSVNIEVTVLEAASIEQSSNRLINKLELPAIANAAALTEVAA
ncbi:hypothetical protein IQ266_19445 [filamentous cyanobacterium LEGE 11480]|uniref:Uncharacterized protein n=1 Tax=Romeriopsis navalis LEGE 11480 TaxID=2777977 RepID=A0A928VTR9_9CYAN|nr:hypothetical protein [Romeriopsis navalis]MBE9031914.1 hypothetical protein [Romeriopsis navalis LEGE 11480]